MRPCSPSFWIFGGCALLAFSGISPAIADVWRVTDAVTSIAFEEGKLEHMGLVPAHVRETASLEDGVRIPVSGTTRTFLATNVQNAPFRVENGAFLGFASGEPFLLQHEGGFTLAASGAAVEPAFLYDFQIELDPAMDADWMKISSGSGPSLFEVRNATPIFDEPTGTLIVNMGDLVMSAEYARRLGEPALEGRRIGTIEVRLSSALIRTEREDLIDKPGGHPPFVDVKLGELYGIDWEGRTGTYPNGMLGLSLATTSCNVGTLDVPWRAPMDERHPTIGMALFRLMNDRLEMIGQSWSKHGFFALSNSQCTPCQNPSNGTYLGVGCSDTYSVGNNASQYYLGARSEVNPHSGEWECVGSTFDGTPVDCQRSYFGNEPNGVNHRLEVAEADLDLPGAQYFYEGIYYVKDDTFIINNIGWRECNMSWVGGFTGWDFNTMGPGILPILGSVIGTWGDQMDTELAAPGDGQFMLATKVTDLGGGQWHYEYACYNRSSDRAVREFKIPVNNANVTNVGFHDTDPDGGNDWIADVSNGFVTWSSDEYGSLKTNPISAQKMFNFRFDSDQAPVAVQAIAGLFKPGAEMEFLLDTQAPPGTSTDVIVASGDREELVLRAEPNPFAQVTRLSFAVPARTEARLTVLDVTGRAIRTLVDGSVEAGRNSVEWDGRDSQGRSVTSGVYFFRIEAAGDVRTIKGTLLR